MNHSNAMSTTLLKGTKMSQMHEMTVEGEPKREEKGQSHSKTPAGQVSQFLRKKKEEMNNERARRAERTRKTPLATALIFVNRIMSDEGVSREE